MRCTLLVPCSDLPSRIFCVWRFSKSSAIGICLILRPFPPFRYLMCCFIVVRRVFFLFFPAGVLFLLLFSFVFLFKFHQYFVHDFAFFVHRFCANKREKRSVCRGASSEGLMQSCPNVRPLRSRRFRSRRTPRAYRPSSGTTLLKGWNATRNRCGAEVGVTDPVTGSVSFWLGSIEYSSLHSIRALGRIY